MRIGEWGMGNGELGIGNGELGIASFNAFKGAMSFCH